MKENILKKSLIFSITFLLTMLSIITVQATIPIRTLQPPDVVYVDDDFNSSTPGWGYDHFDKIQDGINAIQLNGTVNVYSGLYYENIEIIKSLELKGENVHSTIIDGRNLSDVIHIHEDWTTVNGFMIKNGSNGILCSADHIEISGNIITENIDWGVFLTGSYNIVSENSIDNNGHITGTVGATGGIYLALAFSCRISKNNIRNNTERNAFFFKSMFNIWSRNFWDNPRFLPYLIFGIQAIIPPIFWIKIDWIPAKQPYDIS
ncbi:hypothetical protein AYK25_09785 [Thermoplasmatales archaeon SM1-50]|nr:MAG: hypothetical protein AYK25_09785 [Thermoplasmatales archaeon SM1-50]